MNRKLFVGHVLIAVLTLQVLAQNPSPSPAPQTPSGPPDEIVKITTNLVQIDVNVVDENGKTVADLRPEDFEIREDNRPQKITNFSFVTSESTLANGPANPPLEKTNTPTIPPSVLRPADVKRTMAVVVDDIGLAFDSTRPIKDALSKFIDTQMQPGDLVAIIRTSGGVGVLQQFTSDKARLKAAVNSIRWNPVGRTGTLSTETIKDRYATTEEIKDLVEFRNEVLSAGTLEPLAYVIRGLKDLPGRKSIVFFSENLQVTSAVGRNDRLLNAMQKIADMANRSSVVIYTQDASGLQPMNFTAADSSMPGTNDISAASLGGLGNNHDTAEAGLARLRALAESKRVEYETHTVLDYLAKETGGTFSRFTNDLNSAIRKATDDQKSFYLIGYRPDESSFDAVSGRPKFHKWDIKVKRPNLKVRYRSGYFGVAEENRQDVALTPQAQLTKALVSPFASGDVHVRLTTLYRGEGANSFVNSLIHIDGKDLSFKEAPDGWREAAIEVLAITFGENGAVVDQVGNTQSIRVRNDTYQRFLQNGLVYNLSVPVKRFGAYQLRVAVRDTSTGRLGTAGQYVEVPDLSKDRLSLSSIVVSSTDPNAPAQTASTPGPDQFEQQIVSAVRQFRYGTLLDYGYVIYNAQLDKVKKQPQIQTQMRLLRDGKQVFAGKENPFDPTGQPDLKQMLAGGRFQVVTALPPGQYILEVVVTDQLAKEKFRTATQWIDFEVVK
jgi:VWFA-related protein